MPLTPSAKEAFRRQMEEGSGSEYELRHTFATRLSAGGVADHMVMKMLRQSDADVFKRYSQAEPGMMREALAKLDRHVNERGISGTQNLN
jgi:integrase